MMPKTKNHKQFEMIVGDPERRSIPALLRELVTRSGLPPETLRAKTRISFALWRALEKGELNLIPADVYTRRALSSLAPFLGLEGPELWSSFIQERSLALRLPAQAGIPGADDALPKAESPRALRLVPRLSGGSVIVAATILLALVAAFWTTRFLWLGPELTLTSPVQESITTKDESIVLAGRVRRATLLTVNGNQSYPQDNSFNLTLRLRDGMNQLIIVARDRFGRQARAERFIFKE